MSSKQTCPSNEVVRSYVAGELDELEADVISAHLGNCPACEQTVCALEQDDTLADHVRTAYESDSGEATLLQEPELHQVMKSLAERDWRATADTATETVTLHEYEVTGVLGQGGMGTVYRAAHKRLKRAVALKVLPQAMLQRPEAVARFEREMEALGKLSHPNIVQAFDAGEQDGQHYLVMELVEGKNLSEIVGDQGPLRIADAAVLIHQAAQGLQYAHENGIVHRDIKPSNLMLAAGSKSSGPTLKILDLGLARALEFSENEQTRIEELTTTGQVMGTLDYMAPEQGGEAHRVDIRTDIYSLGATFYKLLTGEAPFAAQAKLPPMQRLMAIATTEPPPIREKRPEVPERLAQIIHRMLAKSPENRFSTPDDVIEALRPYEQGADLQRLLTGQHSPSNEDTLPPTPVIKPGNRPPRRTWGSTALGGFAAVLLLGVVLVFGTRHGTVKVESSTGELPKDLQISILKGGDEIALLQADNQWAVQITNGTYDVRVKAGDDRFQLRDNRLTIRRLGNSVVTLDIKPPGTVPQSADGPIALAGPTATTPARIEDLRPSSPAPAELAMPFSTDPPTQGKPFRIVREGKTVRDFTTLAATTEDLQSGDVVEVLSNDRLTIRLAQPITKPLYIRARKGFRPIL
ncbi:MAG: protein kinase, partial [Planctomycetales bacterium]|nr:protein kinase [Planctomycetales bacterium]